MLDPRRWLVIGCLAAGSLALAWGTWRFVAMWRFEAGLDWARQEAASGRYEAPRRWLAGLSPQWSADPEAAYWLGVCSRAEGYHEQAVAAWARVAPGAPKGTVAALERARTLMSDLGRFAEAEVILERLVGRPGAAIAEARQALAQLYFWQGRREAMRRLIEAGWAPAQPRAATLRDLWMIDSTPPRVEMVRTLVNWASRQAPDDDRVWLARANLAIQEGRFDAAARDLDACLTRRPDDAAVWRARLEWARASGSVGETRLALHRMPANELTEVEALALRAWLAAREGDPRGEGLAWEEVIERSPYDSHALDRLAALAWEEGQRDRAAELRRRKADTDRARERYRWRLKDQVPTGSYDELAGLAESLGRWFEADGWWSLAMRQAPGDPVIAEARGRLRPRPKEPRRVAGETLAKRFFGPGGADAVAATVATSPPVVRPDFFDDAEAAGLQFVFDSGQSPLRQLPETMSGGVGLLDYDGDGWLDVYVVQGGTFPPVADRPGAGDRLYRNKGDGTFEDATARSGLAALRRGYGHGVAVGDIDNDGHPDVFVTRWRSYALYRNKGDGTFADVTSSAGLGGERDWPTSAAFADLDGDGDLDLYVCHYLDWDAEHPKVCGRAPALGGQGDASQRPSYCMPHLFASLPDHLFRNDGGRFVDVTADAGVVDHEGRGLGVVAADLDDDGKVDLFVANDATANALYHNLGGLKFEEVGIASGAGCNAEGAFQAGMGVAAGDLDGDGRLDLAVTNFYGESTTFFRNLGRGMFDDQTDSVGLAAPSRFLLGFGAALLDVNDDGRLDLATANGHVLDERPDFPYAMPAQLLIGVEGGRLKDVSAGAGSPWTVPRVGRGLAAGDLDNDGRVDLLILSQNGPLAFIHNRTAGGHSVMLRLEGTASNRDAVGARVTLNSGGRRQVAQRVGGGSYQSAGDPRLHFGLGALKRVDSIEVRWPSGRVDTYRDLEADRGYFLREGEAAPRVLAPFGRSK
ncbi:MAG: FG-GAP-like repeat-containing protein [Isosphaeraceae bacterium]|nr:FG-GAP-like repeat-containing protein [Isosphaeraceae bacterium]